MPVTMTRWTIDSTGDLLLTTDERPIARTRESMLLRAAQWAKQRVVLESVDYVSLDSQTLVIKGRGYELHVAANEGSCPLEALSRAAHDVWLKA